MDLRICESCRVCKIKKVHFVLSPDAIYPSLLVLDFWKDKHLGNVEKTCSIQARIRNNTLKQFPHVLYDGRYSYNYTKRKKIRELISDLEPAELGYYVFEPCKYRMEHQLFDWNRK